MKLRPATLADVPLLQSWAAEPHVVAARGGGADTDWQAEIDQQSQLDEWVIAELDARPIGVMQIVDAAREETHYWGDVEEGLAAIDIWIGEAADLGRGFGTVMMELAIKHCFDKPGIKAVVIDPLAGNTRAHRFYERLGFVFVERRTFDDDDCFVMRLDRGAWTQVGR
jgi:aminoglycoside 6'-N-acetyltransferase